MTTSPCVSSIAISGTTTTGPVPARPDPHHAHVSLYGDIDMATADEALAVLHGALDETYQRLDVDLAGVHFLDSSGITMLMRCWRRAGQLGCRMSVINARPNVYRMLQIAGVIDVLDVAWAG